MGEEDRLHLRSEEEETTAALPNRAATLAMADQVGEGGSTAGVAADLPASTATAAVDLRLANSRAVLLASSSNSTGALPVVEVAPRGTWALPETQLGVRAVRASSSSKAPGEEARVEMEAEAEEGVTEGREEGTVAEVEGVRCLARTRCSGMEMVVGEVEVSRRIEGVDGAVDAVGDAVAVGWAVGWAEEGWGWVTEAGDGIDVDLIYLVPSPCLRQDASLPGKKRECRSDA